MQLQPTHSNKKQSGAFLVIAMILLLVLSSIGIASMALTTISLRVSRNYANYIAADVRAISMSGYGLRILQSFTIRQYPGPGSCDSTSTCNVINNTFPYSGRPVLPWASGLGVTNLQGDAQTNSWWSSHAFGYEASFGDSGTGGNARVLVQLLGVSPTYPDFFQTYQIVGYSTDSTGVVRSTGQTFYTYTGYRPDPYPSSSQLYGTSSCSNGCPYGQCCNGSTCGSDETSCEDGSATFVPAGWDCTSYFVTGLGYDSSACANNIAHILTGFNILDDYGYNAITAYSSAWPSSITWNSNTLPNGSFGDTTGLESYYIYQGEYAVNSNIMAAFVDVSGLTGISGYQDPATVGPNYNNVISLNIKTDGSGDFYYQCGTGTPDDTIYIPIADQPPYCTCQNLTDYYSGGTDCTP